MKNVLGKLVYRAMLVSFWATVAMPVTAIVAPSEAYACKSIKCAFRHVSKAVKTTVDKGVKFANSTTQAAASFSQQEFDAARSGVNTAISATGGALEQGYMASINGLAQFFDDILMRLFRSAGRSFLKNNDTLVRNVNTCVNTLSDDARGALKQIISGMPNLVKTIADTSANGAAAKSTLFTAMQLVGQELGFMGSATSACAGPLVQAYQNTSWGITLSASAGAGITGQNVGISLACNSLPDNNYNIPCAVVASQGRTLGITDGVTGSVGIFWQPSVAASGGPSVGLGLSIATVETGGAAFGLSWGIPSSANDYASLYKVATYVPSFSLDVDLPGTVITEAEISGDLNFGMSNVLASFVIPSGQVVKFATTINPDGTKSTKKL